jgi:hypothetical protein
MKDALRKLAGEAANPWQSRNLVREYLQARILQFMQESGGFGRWIFHGGTALRFLYGLPRFSEGLDFALAEWKKTGMDGSGGVKDDRAAFSKTMEKARTWFSEEAYEVNVKIDPRRTVVAAWLRFPGLLAEIGLSTHRTEALAVKVELDTRPPASGKTETTVVRHHVLLRLLHYDRAALLAGKLHAVLTRPYTKGRDLYDLLWYLSDPGWPAPDVVFLGAALSQTGWKGPAPTQGNWAGIVEKRLDAIDWPKAVADVKPFLERPADLTMMTREELGLLLRNRNGVSNGGRS